MDAEQARRIELAVEAASAQAKVRESARTTALMAAEAERERRIAEWHAIAADEARSGLVKLQINTNASMACSIVKGNRQN